MTEIRICEFGFPGPLRDRLISAVLSGIKTATSSLLVEWEAEGEELPQPGDLETVINSAGEAVATIEITACEVRKLADVDDVVARAEGEEYLTAVGWRVAHERFWRDEVLPVWEGSEPPSISDHTPVVVQWFHVKEQLGPPATG